MNELKKCPFCGSEAKIVGGPEDWHPTCYDPDSGGDPYSVVCSGCACWMALAFWDSDEAIAAWNRRAEPDTGIPATENKPLTLEELRGMCGEPIWVSVNANEQGEPSCWAIVGDEWENGEGVELHSLIEDDGGAYDYYGKTWIAYRRKPELKGGEG